MRVVEARIVKTITLTLRRLMIFKLLERKRKIRAQSQQAKLYVYKIEKDETCIIKNYITLILNYSLK